MNNKSCLVTDNDGHWYVIAVSCRDSWEEWLKLQDNTEAPEFAAPVVGSPSLVEFEKYEIL